MSLTRRQLVLSTAALLPTANVFARSGEVHTWSHGDDWVARVAYEARAAFHAAFAGAHSQNTNSPVLDSQLPSPYGTLQGANAYWGTVNYVPSDQGALNAFKSETVADQSGGTGGPFSGPGGKIYYKGGECTFFAGLVLYRATYWAFTDHYPTPNYPNLIYSISDSKTTNVWSTVGPGWVVMKKPGTPGADGMHIAIIERVGTHNHQVGGVPGLWLIDANYVGQPTYTHAIGYHFMPFTTLNDRTYRAWKPNIGTYNQ